MNANSERIIELFSEAMALPSPDERAHFLAGACKDEPEVREHVEALLRAGEPSADFLRQPPPGTGPAVDPVTEKPGDVFGPYTLLKPIGEGGFGVVWMAEQCQPIRRTVALKVIKAGMDTKQVLARFEAERQALAMMDHPNIARVIDAGATPAGRPYFAMELVKGIPITEFCDQENLDTRQRLELFRDVCAAVNHAHQKGIIHRDLKPSNILVSRGVDFQSTSAAPGGLEVHATAGAAEHPHVKVIDFGIAKATEQKLTDKTLFTRSEQFVGTPVYMSPEQAGMGASDIDTRSDIYSLGMLLYELLAGRPAFDPKTLMAAGYDEMRRIIKEVEPLRPSVRLTQSRTRAAADPSENSALRTPQSAIDPDLDWIVMKALEKDRTRRYETANALSADIRRHLTSEPVMARPASKAYRFQKAFRRNRLAFTAAAAVALAVITGAIVSTWQAVEASRARDAEKQQRLAAQTERDAKAAALQEAEAVSTFLTGVLQSPDPARNGATLTVAEVLGIAAKKLDTDLAGQPARQAKLQATLGQTYFALGLIPDAVPLQEHVLDYCRSTSGPEHPDTLRAMTDLALSYWSTSRRGEALKIRDEVLALSRRVLGPEHPDTLTAMSYLARSCNQAGRVGEAIKLNEDALAISRRVLGPEDLITLRAMRLLSESLSFAGRSGDALKIREEALPLHRRVLGPEHPDSLFAMMWLANSYRDASRFAEAIKLREERVAICHKVFGPEHARTLEAIGEQAEDYSLAGRKDEALKLREEVLTLTRKEFGPEYPATLVAMWNLAYSYDESDRRDEGLRLREELVVLFRKVLGAESSHALYLIGELADSYDKFDRHEEALKLREEAVPLWRKVRGPEDPDTLNAMGKLASSYNDAGRREEALKLREELVPLFRKVRGPESPDTLNTMLDLSRSYSRAGRRDEAFKLRDEALTARKQALAPVIAAFPAVRATLVDTNAEWKWLHPTDGKDPAESVPGFHKTFALPTFDDSKWTTGRDKGGLAGGFGYGDVFDGVDIGKPEGGAHRHTAYFRCAFTTDTEHAHLELRCQRDDGIIVYLDGKDVQRDNVEDSEEAYLLHCKTFTGVEDDGVVHRYPIPGSLAPGAHMLAISVHNTSDNSSDLYLGGVTLVEVEPAADGK